MKRYFTLLLALLLAVSAMFGASSCSGDHDDHNHSENGENGTQSENTTPDEPITGNAYDGGFFTSLIPNGMDAVSVDQALAVYVDFTNGKTLLIQNRKETLATDESGAIDYTALEESFSEEALRKIFSLQLDENNYLEKNYTVVFEHRLYRLDVVTKASSDASKTVYGTVYAVISAPDAENNVSIAVMILNGDYENRKIATAIAPVLK